MKFRDKKRHLLTLPRKEFESVKPMTVPELVAEIHRCCDQIERIKGRIIAAVPVKVGDTVTINSGGSLGKQMLVNTVEVHQSEGQWHFTAEGVALTVEGKPGTRRGIHTFVLGE